MAISADDWPTYRKDNGRSGVSGVKVPAAVEQNWEVKPTAPTIPTAPVVAGGLVLTGGADGAMRAVEADSGKPRWTVFDMEG